MRKIKKTEDFFEGEETLSREALEELEQKGHLADDGGEESPYEDVYPDAELNIARHPVSVFQLKRQYDKKPTSLLKLDPDFQRELVWNEKQKSELIESILMGIPLPLIYVKEDSKGVYIIIDGRQRLTTIFDFMNNTFKLQKLNVLPNINGKNFSELDQKQQNKIEDCSLTLHVIKPPTSDRVIFDLFDRVNRGGTRLNNQEMRNAFYQGNSTRLLNQLSKSENFKRATDYSINSTRMKDRYLILRFLAFYLWQKELLLDVRTGEKIVYRSDLENFLSNTMLFINSNQNNSVVEKLPAIFEETMKKCFEFFGEGCFRLPKKHDKTRRPINMALFETISYFVAALKDVADNKNNLIKEKYKQLINNDEYVKSLTHTVDSNVSINARFGIINAEIQDILNA